MPDAAAGRVGGLVVGKFYPPHRGHKHLIDTAAARVDELTVMVARKAGEAPDADLRASWLREIHPAARVIVVDDILRDDDSAAWAAYTVEVLGRAPDVVFTSEDYGDPYARYLGARHVLVDRERRAVPVSGTAVRARPLAHWDYLEPCVRAYYAVRVCVVGAESSGTTTLARALAEHYGTVWVPEYGREYCERLPDLFAHAWDSAEFVHIAEEQCRREDRAAREANRLLVCDTDAFATGIWHRRYLGRRCPAVEALAAPRRYALCLLTDIRGVPFEQDGLRDGEHLRAWMQALFEEELRAQGRRYALLSGTHEERLAAAIRLIDPLLA